MSNLDALADELGYDKETVKRVLAEVAEEYGNDRGRGMIDRAFRRYDEVETTNGG